MQKYLQVLGRGLGAAYLPISARLALQQLDDENITAPHVFQRTRLMFVILEVSFPARAQRRTEDDSDAVSKCPAFTERKQAKRVEAHEPKDDAGTSHRRALPLPASESRPERSSGDVQPVVVRVPVDCAQERLCLLCP